jgi:aspartyl-tRNA(Asn)/glutamyl-tRNA(Gln) amidotransferase subunit C
MLKNSMKLTREEVERVATLARLRLTAAEESLLAEQLEKILQYMEKLNQLDTSEVKPFTQAEDVGNAWREDTVTNHPDEEALLANAPAREDGFFKVPKIIE